MLRGVPGAFRRSRPGRLAADVIGAALRPGPGLVPFGRARLHPSLVRGTRARLAGARRRGRCRATDPSRRRVDRHDPGPRGAPGVGAPADRLHHERRHGGGLDPRGLGPARRARRAHPHPARVRHVVRHARGAVDARARRPPGRAARRRARDLHRPTPGARPDGPRQQRGLRRLARRAGHRHRRGRAGRDPGAATARSPRVRPRRGTGDDGHRPALERRRRRRLVDAR